MGRYFKKKNIHPIVSNFLSTIGSKGGKNGSREDKIKAGKAKSKAKAEASRLNGLKGGRPVLPIDLDEKLAIKKKK